MSFATETLLSILEAHPYLLLFPLVMVEGPATTVCAGALASIGLLEWPIALALAATADLTGDSIYYLLGHSGRHRRMRRLLSRIGLTDERLARLEWEVRKNGAKALIGAKIVDTASIPVLVSAGLARMGYVRFMGWNVAATLPKATLLTTLGYFFAEQSVQYIDRASAVVFLLALVLILGFAVRVLSKRISRISKEYHYEGTDR